MKRLLILLLVMCLCFGICACNSGVTEPETTTDPDHSSAPTTVPPTTAAPTTEPTTAPTTAPATTPKMEYAAAPNTEPTTASAVEPAVPTVLLCDTLYRLSDANGEGRTKTEILKDTGILEDAWFVRFSDGTGLISLQGDVERIFFKDEIFWDPVRVYTYEIDEEGQLCFSRDYGDITFRFAPTQEKIPSVTLPQECFDLAILDACDGVWVGYAESGGTMDGRFPVGTAVTVELSFEDTGECVPVFTIDLDADCSNDRMAAREEPGLDGMRLHGRLLGQPVLADSSLIIDGDALLLWLRIGDPTAADTYTVQVRLERLDPGSAVG